MLNVFIYTMRVDLSAQFKYRPEEYKKKTEIFFEDLHLFIHKSNQFDHSLVQKLMDDACDLGFPELYLLLSVIKDDQQIKPRYHKELAKHFQFVERMVIAQ